MQERIFALIHDKTNALRLLSSAGIPHKIHEYPCLKDKPVDGLTVAGLIGKDAAVVYKTLVARGASKTIYVFVINVADELSLKKAAAVTGEKSVAMLHVSELTPTTGYVRGGCSPIGMRKNFRTFFDCAAQAKESIVVSAGRLGMQLECAPDELLRLTGASYADIAGEKSGAYDR